MKIIVKSISYQHVMPDDAYACIMQHLNEELPVTSIDFDQRTGKLFCIAVAVDDCKDRVAVIFESNRAKFQLIGLEELSCIDTI